MWILICEVFKFPEQVVEMQELHFRREIEIIDWVLILEC